MKIKQYCIYLDTTDHGKWEEKKQVISEHYCLCFQLKVYFSYLEWYLSFT